MFLIKAAPLVIQGHSSHQGHNVGNNCFLDYIMVPTLSQVRCDTAFVSREYIIYYANKIFFILSNAAFARSMAFRKFNVTHPMLHQSEKL